MWSHADATKFAAVGLIFEVLMVVVYHICFTYVDGTLEINGEQVKDGGVGAYYGMFQDVHVMIFVGFGFLMTFLAHHGFGSVGLNFMVAAVVIQWAIVANNVIERIWHGEEVVGIPIRMQDLVTADFAAGAVLISFGAVVGRISPLQLLAMAVFELVFYAINENIGVQMGAADAGGSMIVHAFGAYFGLAVSLAMSRGKSGEYTDHPLNGSNKMSDMFAMIGTLFLWIFWPSFTGVLCHNAQRYRVVVNTILSLTASCMGAFSFTLLFRPEKKFNMVDIQNATLAAGVAIGSVCNMNVSPAVALAVGLTASLVSTAGYVFVSPALERSLGLFDTCGVNNLHGMPGLLGGLCGVLAAATTKADTYTPQDHSEIYSLEQRFWNSGEQALRQLGCLGTTLAMALVSGYMVGTVLNTSFFLPVTKGQEYQDEIYWEIEGEHEHDPKAKELTPGGEQGEESGKGAVTKQPVGEKGGLES